MLRVRVEMLEMQLGRERDSVDDLRKRLDRSEDRVLALTAARVPPMASPVVVTEVVTPALIPASPKPPAGFLSRLFGRG